MTRVPVPRYYRVVQERRAQMARAVRILLAKPDWTATTGE